MLRAAHVRGVFGVSVGIALASVACAIDVTGTASDVAAALADGATPDDPAPPEAGLEQPLEPEDGGLAEGGAGADAGRAAFVVVPPPGGTFTIFPPGTRNPCSRGGGGATSFRVENQTDQSARIFWYDTGCNERDYGRVGAKSGRTQGTFIGHRWRVRRGGDNALLGDFVIDSAPQGGVFRVILR